MSVVDPGLQVPGAQVRDDSWPFSSVVISTDTTEPTTEPSPLPELCVCPLPREVTQLNMVVEAVTAINCKALSLTNEMQSTVLTVTIQGNECNSFGEVAMSIGSGGIPEGTGGGEPPEIVGTFNALIPLEMLIAEAGVFDPYAENTTYYSMAVRINPTDYDGLVASYFEACMRIVGNPPRVIQLVDENGTVYATITNSSVSAFTRIRGTFTLDPNNTHDYQFKTIANALDNDELEFHNCKILLEVQNSNRVKLQFILDAGNDDGYGGDEASEDANNIACYSHSGGSHAYDYMGLPLVAGGAGTHPYLHNYFLKDESKFAAIEEWEFEVSALHWQGVPCGCAANCKAALYNTTSGLQVAGTELTGWTPGSVANPAVPEIKRVTFSNTATNFNDLCEFTYKHILDPQGQVDGCEFHVVRAALYVTLIGSAIKGQIFHRLSTGSQESRSQEHNDIRYLHQPTKYSAGTTWFHEVSGKLTTAGAGSSVTWLKDLGTSDVLTVGTNVTNSDVTWTGTQTRHRTAALSLTDGNRYYGNDVEAAGTQRMSHGHSFLIAEVPSA